MPSSVIAGMVYDPAAETLRITFVSGLVYDYQDVPEDVFNGLKSSGAKGIYLNQHIKGKYRFEKINHG